MTAAPERPTILIVDDEPEILVALTDLFEDDHVVLASSSPAAALELIDRHAEIAVIVSDQRMPEMTGHQFLARARTRTTADAILLTGYADLSAVISAVNEGAISGYVHKPWEPEALRAMVSAAVERHRLRQAVAFERAAFGALADRDDVRVTLVDRAHRIVRTNGALPDLPPVVDRAADEAAMAGGTHGEQEEAVLAPDGGERWVRVRRVPFGTAETGRHLLRIESDETGRRLSEQRVHQAEKLQALGTLAGGIAHDFNNLLAVILGNLELASLRTGDPDRLTRYLSHAQDAATRGSAVSRRLLAFSRQRDLAAETFAPDETVRGIEELVARAMAGRVSLRFDLPPDLGHVHTDPGQFELAIVNLCINARDAMAEGGEILISGRDREAELPAGLETGAYVAITVADEGCGMDEALQQRVFEPFFTTKPRGSGTGLGLPMARAVARAAGGEVTIDSAPGQGTRVTMWLPRVASAIAQPPAATGPQPDRPLRILLAEDDAAVAAMLIEQLRESGHAIVATTGGEEALARLEEEAGFDLLITDFAMPRLSGAELAQAVGTRWPHIAILLITGFAEVEGGLPDLEILTKPFTGSQLAAALTRAIERSAQMPEVTL